MSHDLLGFHARDTNDMKLDYFASQNAPDFVRVEFDGNENYVRYQSITRIIKDAARRAKLRGV